MNRAPTREHEPFGLGELDLHLLGEGRHRRLWEVLGSNPTEGGWRFAVWAPNALEVEVLGDWNGWRPGVSPLTQLGESGVWAAVSAAARPGDCYKYRLRLPGDRWVLRADPLARLAEAAPRTASRVPEPSGHEWSDGEGWTAARRERNAGRLSIYEVHANSWRWDDDGRPLGYRAIAEPLAEHVRTLGFSHVEFMPLATHPFGGSWGYQVTGYYAPDARGGTPDDLRFLVDTLHAADVGVIFDWVPAHFPRDEGALARFDGTALYEHADPRRGEHPDWGTYVFNHGRNEVRNFLVANALYWLEEFRLDGLRVDAVASMLYLDYSRPAGGWVPNAHGGREDLEALAFIRELNTVVGAEHEGAVMIAEESTAWPRVTAPVHHDGLGFARKWNLGWMHDTLHYLQRDPIHRRHHHHDFTFPLMYAHDERWVLPLSHDEVVHGKGSLLQKMPGDRWQQLANLRCLYAWQWFAPGDQLLFMGGELAEEREWADHRQVDWWLGDRPEHAGIARLVGDLNALERDHPALWRGDHDHSATWWLDADRAEESVFALARRDPGSGEVVVCVANLTPVPRPGYRVGLPWEGRWNQLLDTDDPRYGGSGAAGGDATLQASAGTPWQGQPASTVLTIGPLAVRWLAAPPQ